MVMFLTIKRNGWLFLLGVMVLFIIVTVVAPLTAYSDPLRLAIRLCALYGFVTLAIATAMTPFHVAVSSSARPSTYCCLFAQGEGGRDGRHAGRHRARTACWASVSPRGSMLTPPCAGPMPRHRARTGSAATFFCA